VVEMNFKISEIRGDSTAGLFYTVEVEENFYTGILKLLCRCKNNEIIYYEIDAEKVVLYNGEEYRDLLAKLSKILDAVKKLAGVQFDFAAEVK
jgi:hypothetical protein